jgi:mycothiol maleylpyruvate isomerase-like protein
MTDPSVRQRLSAEEAAGWDTLVAEVDRIPPDRAEMPGAGADGWTLKDVLFHLAAWCEEAAGQLAAVREGRYRPPSIETDARNEECLRAGRAIDLASVRVRLERGRARMLAEWAAAGEPPPAATEWFAESGDEHYREHLAELRSFADAGGSSGRTGATDRRAGLLGAEAEAWAEIAALVDGLPPDALERPDITPEGWTVKDTMWHVAMWWEDLVGSIDGFADPAFDPDAESDEEIDARNRAWVEESRRSSLAEVRARWEAARAAGLDAFRSMPDPPRLAERWLEECGTIHYEKHLIDLRPWAANQDRLPGSAGPSH